MKMLLPLLAAGFMALGTQAQTAPYQDRSLTPEERADDLLSRLTIEEKCSLMMDVSPAIERLGIPAYNWWNEALHGVGRAGLSTVLPQAIGMAATFDDAALEEAFSMVSDEARAKYNQARRNGDHSRYRGLTFWTPNINIFRDPRWGRGQETYGEDPYLTSKMGSAVVRGLQGPDSANYRKTLACAKHYAVHSGPEWNRHTFNAADIDPRDLWETYLPAFHALVDAGVGQVMCAYNRFEGEACCGSNTLLQKILRNEWGYENIVVSDCGAISDFLPRNHHVVETPAEAAGLGVVRGTDLECGGEYRHLGEALRNGNVKESDIDRSVCRLLVARFRLGEMDDDPASQWASLGEDRIASASNREMAREMARRSMTLLKNNGVLPLPTTGVKLMVMGPNATDSVMQWGNYQGKPSHTVTILEGIRNRVPEAGYKKGCGFVVPGENIRWIGESVVLEVDSVNAPKPDADAGDADVVIFVGGISPTLEGEEMPVKLPGFRGGDRESIELPAIQRQFIADLKAQGKKVVFVNCSGSSVAIAPEAELCDAILQAWYPGEEGGNAVADVIFGDYNPAGRLPVTFYANDSQLPDYQDYDMEGHTYRYMRKAKPLYAFGHGLSYTDFKYHGARFASKPKAGEPATLLVDLENTGDRDGEEVIQVYVRRLDDYAGPVKALRAFKRVPVKAGERITVEVPMDADAFAAFDNDKERMTVRPGAFRVSYGGSSDRTSDIFVNL